MVKRGVEFGFGLAGTIINGGIALGSLVMSIIMGISMFGHGSYNLFDYMMDGGLYFPTATTMYSYLGFLFSILFLVFFVMFIVLAVLYAACFVLSLIGTIGLKKNEDKSIKKASILLIVSGCLGNIFSMTAGIVALGKSPDRIVNNKPNNKKMEFALGLAGGVFIVLSAIGRIFYQISYSDMLYSGYSSYYMSPIESITLFLTIAMTILFCGAAAALSIIGAVKIKNKTSEEYTKAEGVLMLIGGIVGINPLSLSAGILALTKRGKNRA